MPVPAKSSARAGSYTLATVQVISYSFWAIWAHTMLVLSPSVTATKASAPSMPASLEHVPIQGCTGHESPGEVVAEQLERVVALVDDGHVVAFGHELLGDP